MHGYKGSYGCKDGWSSRDHTSHPQHRMKPNSLKSGIYHPTARQSNHGHRRADLHQRPDVAGAIPDTNLGFPYTEQSLDSPHQGSALGRHATEAQQTFPSGSFPSHGAAFHHERFPPRYGPSLNKDNSSHTSSFQPNNYVPHSHRTQPPDNFLRSNQEFAESHFMSPSEIGYCPSPQSRQLSKQIKWAPQQSHTQSSVGQSYGPIEHPVPNQTNLTIKGFAPKDYEPRRPQHNFKKKFSNHQPIIDSAKPQEHSGYGQSPLLTDNYHGNQTDLEESSQYMCRSDMYPKPPDPDDGSSSPQILSGNLHQPEKSVDAQENAHKIKSTGSAVDQEWINCWLTKNKICHRTKEKQMMKFPIKVPHGRRMMREALGMIEDLQQVQSELHDSLHCEPKKWGTLCQNSKELKTRLTEIRTVMSEATVEQLASKMSRIARKRLRIKAKRRKDYKSNVKKLKQRDQLHQKFDNWQAQILKKDEDKKREKELKAAADETLAEVRRKLQEAERAHDLLIALTKLRQLRKEAAERKSVNYPLQLDIDFKERIDEQLAVLQEQLKVYAAEKMTLEAMLEMEAEENREKAIEEKKQKIEELGRRKERTIKRILFGREEHPVEEDPMLPFQQFYNQADDSIENLIQIRHAWDLFLVPPSSGGSRLPDGWVMPCKPTSDTWASVLKDRSIV